MAGFEFPTLLIATTSTLYVVPSCNPLSTAVFLDAVVCRGGEPSLGTAVTVYPVIAGLFADTGAVHMIVMDEHEEAVAVTPPGAEGTARITREKVSQYKKYLQAQ